MMNHNPQQNYPKQNAPGMFDARPAVSTSTPQPDSYGNGIPTNRGMMERMEVPQQNMENAAKGYYAYSQRNQPLNTPWMRNPENRYQSEGFMCLLGFMTTKTVTLEPD